MKRTLSAPLPDSPVAKRGSSVTYAERIAEEIHRRGARIVYDQMIEDCRIVAITGGKGRVTDVYFISEGSVKCAQTTGSYFDNHTPMNPFPVENSVFGMDKVLCAIQAVRSLSGDTEENRKLLEIKVPNAVKQMIQKKPELDDPEDQLVSLAKGWVYDATPKEFEELKSNWIVFHETIIPCLKKTHPKLAKMAVGRVMPFKLIEKPFDETVCTAIAYARVDQLMRDPTALCIVISTDADEEFSWTDDKWAKQVGPEIEGQGPLCCFKHGGDDKLRMQVIDHMMDPNIPLRKLGSANDQARRIAFTTLRDAEVEEETSETRALLERGWNECFEETDIFKPIPRFEDDAVGACLDDRFQLADILDALKRMEL